MRAKMTTEWLSLDDQDELNDSPLPLGVQATEILDEDVGEAAEDQDYLPLGWAALDRVSSSEEETTESVYLTKAENAEILHTLRYGSDEEAGDAFQRAYNAFHANMRARVRRIMDRGTNADIDDVVQEVFIHALWVKRETLRTSGKLSNYLITCMTRAALNANQQLKTHGMAFVDPTAGLTDEDGIGGAYHACTAEDTAYATSAPYHDTAREVEAKNSIAYAMSMLSERERRAVDLVKLQELTYKDAARELGVKENTVKSRVNGALAKMRVAIENEFGTPEFA